MDKTEAPKLLTPEEAAEALRLHYRTALKMCERGEFECFQTAEHGHWRIRTDAEGLPRIRRPARDTRAATAA